MVHAERWAWKENRLQRRGARETLLTRYRDLLRALEELRMQEMTLLEEQRALLEEQRSWLRLLRQRGE